MQSSFQLESAITCNLTAHIQSPLTAMGVYGCSLGIVAGVAVAAAAAAARVGVRPRRGDSGGGDAAAAPEADTPARPFDGVRMAMRLRSSTCKE